MQPRIHAQQQRSFCRASRQSIGCPTSQRSSLAPRPPGCWSLDFQGLTSARFSPGTTSSACEFNRGSFFTQQDTVTSIVPRRTRRRTDPSLYHCQLPIFPGKRLLSYASNPRSRYHDMFATCTRCPLFSQSYNYYVSGGVRKCGCSRRLCVSLAETAETATLRFPCSVNSLTKDDIKALPALQAWKTFYHRIAPSLSMCLAVNPCLMNGELLCLSQEVSPPCSSTHLALCAVHLGVAGLQRGVSIQSQGVAVRMILHQYYFSFGTNTVPPAWRQSTPRFWMMYDTQAFNNTGAAGHPASDKSAAECKQRSLVLCRLLHLC